MVELFQKVLVKCTSQYESCRKTHLRADVQSTTLPVRFARQVRRELAVLVERDVIDDESTILHNGVNGKCALARLGDGYGGADGEGGFGAFCLGSFSGTLLALGDTLVGGINVRNGEEEADSRGEYMVNRVCKFIKSKCDALLVAEFAN